jgi:hypothetical protein
VRTAAASVGLLIPPLAGLAAQTGFTTPPSATTDGAKIKMSFAVNEVR